MMTGAHSPWSRSSMRARNAFTPRPPSAHPAGDGVDNRMAEERLGALAVDGPDLPPAAPGLDAVAGDGQRPGAAGDGLAGGAHRDPTRGDGADDRVAGAWAGADGRLAD